VTAVPLSREVRDHVARRAVELFTAEHPDCGPRDAQTCPCGCSVYVRVTCPDLDPSLVLFDRAGQDATIVGRNGP
jgi:hypothetical protein